MGKSIKNQIPWTKELYNKFTSDAILSDIELKVLYARVWERDKWTITKMALEFHVSRTTINNTISSIRRKYDYLQCSKPDVYPKRITTLEEKKQMVDKMCTKRV